MGFLAKFFVKEHWKDFTIEKFEESLDKKKGRLKGLKALMVDTVPGFEEEKQYIMQKFNKNQENN
ncbi:hypothetical protein AKJ39_05200 [candidate division MSBL1 archaeon SCGC-AAA259J03]|uniref:Uncharacterized protein n=1 Tax=candidate division MSBL1 archaeon SCGC-AAA259J03 TaxID=1698269 RepID=A0A656YUI4_9EURY|nr:hypothetical protein AKJ39_05200 [candidate division MSBL1 archaeon SCGC-AAA259J03]